MDDILVITTLMLLVYMGLGVTRCHPEVYFSKKMPNPVLQTCINVCFHPLQTFGALWNTQRNMPYANVFMPFLNFNRSNNSAVLTFAYAVFMLLKLFCRKILNYGNGINKDRLCYQYLSDHSGWSDRLWWVFVSYGVYLTRFHIMLSPGKQFSGMCYFFIVIMTMSADTASDLNLFSLEFVRLRHITVPSKCP